MRFHVASYRRGLPVLRASGAYDELCRVLESIDPSEIKRRRAHLQEQYRSSAAKAGRTRVTKAGIQTGLNALLKEELAGKRGWKPEVAVFPKDKGAGKGMWTVDFVKTFDEGIRVGLEVTFNHAEAIPWTLIRPTLAHEAEHVLEDARIHVGAIIIATDHLKGSGKEKRMDGAVGTYERLRTLVPKMRSVLPAPFVFFGLDWAPGGLAGEPEELSLHRSDSGLGAWG